MNTLTDLYAKYPCLTNRQPVEQASEKYRLVTTADRLEKVFLPAGFTPMDVSAAGGKQAVFGKHYVTLVAPEQYQTEPDKGLLTLVYGNSYDRSWKERCFIGYFNGMCFNGLVFGDHLLPGITMIHSGDAERATDQVREFIAKFQQAFDAIQAMRNTTLDASQVGNLAIAAAKVRWGSVNDVPEKTTILSMAAARRSGEQENTLWNVFNRLQETLVRGQQGNSIRELKSVSERLRVNRELFDVAYQQAA